MFGRICLSDATEYDLNQPACQTGHPKIRTVQAESRKRRFFMIPAESD
jgi:hypothetical protein